MHKIKRSGKMVQTMIDIINFEPAIGRYVGRVGGARDEVHPKHRGMGEFLRHFNRPKTGSFIDK